MVSKSQLIVAILSAFMFAQCPSQLISDYPLSTDPNDVHFYFYPLNGNPVREQEIIYNNTESLSSSAFNQNAGKTVFLIHGFTDNRTVHLDTVVLPAYLNSTRDYNYIVVDWGLLSANTPFSNQVEKFELYNRVVSQSAPLVSKRTTDFIKFLGVELSKIHIIGHSLGAHISGSVGYNSQSEPQGTTNKIARITGLDPAGPSYALPISWRKLSKSDATFVDVIHTNAGFLGDISVDGHVSFFPNGGSVQPGCKITSDSCSHQFAPILYAASLTKTFLACKCVSVTNDQETLLEGVALRICLNNCPGNQIPLGVDCPTSARGLYSLNTGNPP